MRWPFSLLFRGDRDAPAATDAVAASSSVPGAALGPADATGVPERPAAWRGLPPMRRVAADFPLTAPAVPFGRDLAGRRPPDPILRPLAHDLAADGPAGLVSGIATSLAGRAAPATALAGHAALPPPRGVQRRARTVSGAPPAAREGAGSAADPPPPVVAGAAAPDLPVLPPPRVLPVVSPSAAASALAATRVGASTVPETAHAVAPASAAAAPAAAGISAQRSMASPAQPGMASLAQSSVASPARSVAAGPAAPTIAPPVAPSAGPDAAPDEAGPTPGGDAPSLRPAQSRSLGESRRLGLGAPVIGRPSVQRVAAGPDLPLARAGRTAVPPTSPAAASPPQRRAAAAEASLPVLRVASEGGRPATPLAPAVMRPAEGAAVAPPTTIIDPSTGDDGAGPGTSALQRSGERPLVGDGGRRVENPSTDGADIGSSAAEPRDALAPAAWTGIHDGSVGHGGAPVADPAEDATAGPPPAFASTAASAATGPLSVGHGGLVLPAPPSTAPAAPVERSVPLVVARSLRGTVPLRPGAGVPPAAPPAAARRIAEAAGGTAAAGPGFGDAASPTGAPSTAGARAPRSAASGWPVAQRSPAEEPGSAQGPDARPRRGSLPLARAAATAGPPGPTAGPISGPVAVSRLADGGGSMPPPPPRAVGWNAGNGFAALPPYGSAVVQRSVVVEEMDAQAEPAPVASAAEGGAGGAGAGGAGQDYEEVADRVYDRIRSRFATELLLDRERMGLLIDG